MSRRHRLSASAWPASGVGSALPRSLDGRPHRLRLCGRLTDGLQLVAVDLRIDLDLTAAQTAPVAGAARMTVTLTVPQGAPGSVAWAATSVGATSGQLTNAATDVRSTPAATSMRTTATVNLAGLPFEPVEVVSTAFRPPAAVPVAVSRRLVAAYGVAVGDRLSVAVGITPVPVVVAEVVPAVPSVPDGPALLADVDVLSRALIGTGALEPAVDAWWVGRPTGSGAAGAAALGLGGVVTRAGVSGQLTGGPLRVGLPAALTVLLPAAVLLALAGTVLHVTSDMAARALEVARLRGMGLSRRGVLGVMLAQYGAVLALLLAAGALVGALASRAVGPALVRSEIGTAPVPPALARWPWPTEGALLAVLLAGCTTAVALVVAIQVRRADATHPRAGP